MKCSLGLSTLLALLQVCIGVLIFPTEGFAQAAHPQVYVRGFVFAEVRDRFEQPHSIALPHASVFLADARDNSKVVTENISDLSGHFTLKAEQLVTPQAPLTFVPPPPAFALCVKAEGFDDVCDDRRIVTSSDLGHIIIRPKKGERAAAIFGNITLHDGNLARGFEPMFGVNAYPIIEMQSSSGLTYKGFVNNYGSYIIPNVPINEDLVLRAMIEKEKLERRISKSAALFPGVGYEFTFQFANSAPRVRLVSASSDGKLLQVAKPGSMVRLHAVAADQNSDNLQYRWLTPDAGTAVGPNNTPDFDWKIPSQDGVYTVRVLVGDGRGGYARGFINLLATSRGVTFSGTVTDQNGKPIPGAQLVVNGRVTNANSKGKAELAVPVQDKYAVTVSQPVPNPPAQPAYGAASFIYTSGIRGAQWRLRPAQVATFDPTLPIVLQHVRTRKDCDATRPRLSKIDWTPYLRPGLFDWQDGAGNSLSLAEMVLNHPEAIRQATLLLARTNPELAKFFFDTANSSIVPKSFGNTGHGRGTVHFDRSDEVHPFVFDFSILDNGGILGDEGSPPYVSQALPCRNGIKVEIPPNSLENPATKKPPSGPVQVAVSMVDLNGPDQMPGDYTAIDSSGQRTAMESYGAGSVEISSGAERFNLKAGATATVTIPVDSTQLVGAPVLPATIPILFYDESAGVWKEDGTGHLIGSGVSSVYVTTRTHFSPLNGDILKSGESCVAVEVDPMAGFTFPLSVEVNLQPSRPNPTAVQVRTLTINSSGEHSVIYNLPNNEDIALTPIIPGTLPNGDSGDVPAGIFVVNTGGAQNSPTAPPTPNADGTYYNGTSGPCASKVTLKKLNASTAPGAPYEFLQGLYFESSNISEFASDPNTVNIANAIVQGAKDYYLQADARNKRPDLNSFKQVNRFGQLQSPPDEVEFSAVYANGGDLGFGREMHCRRNLAADSTPADKKFDYACYVSNCHQPPIFLADQQDADDTNAHTCDVTDATVAMEYSRVENPSADPQEFPDNNRAVKFYAYNTNAGTQVFQADLDGHGARPLPNLCVVCHGGRSADGIADASTGAKKPAFTARSDIINEGSKFLPFDLHYYKFPALNLRSAQEDSFRNLNIEIVEQVATQINATDPVAELIDAWYPGHVGIQRDDAVIVGWDTGGAGNPNHQDNRMYRDVFARACRTCHVAQPYAGPTFTTVASFKNDIQTVQQRVCINKVMPHAQRTSDIFWTSLNPNMPGFLEIFGQPEAGWLTDINSQCGLFNQDSNSLRSFFEGTVYPVLTSNCASSNCHGQIGNANWHVGSVPATYNELLTAATNRQITGGRYVQPNNLANSLLYQKIDGTAYGSLMPLGGVDLRTHDTNGNGAVDVTDVLNWITTFVAVGP